MTANLTSASHADNSRYPQETGRSRFFPGTSQTVSLGHEPIERRPVELLRIHLDIGGALLRQHDRIRNA